MHVTQDEVVSTIRWRLGLPVDANAPRYQEIWDRLHRDPTIAAQLERVARSLSQCFMEQAARQRLELPASASSVEERANLDQLWDVFVRWLGEHSIKWSPRLAGIIRDIVSNRNPAAPPNSAPVRPPARHPAYTPPPPARPPASAPARPAQVPPSAPVATPNPVNTDMPSPDPGKPRPSSQWQYKPVPEHEPDPYPEYLAPPVVDTPDGGRLVGARVRGKKHKHEATNCDDWFATQIAGPWTLIAVADGAGSRKLSRLGARASCDAAVRCMARDLGEMRISDCANAEGLLVRDGVQNIFIDQEMAAVQNCLVRATIEAREAVKKAAADLSGSAAYKQLIGRDVGLEDLSATLLLAAHTTVRIGDARHSLVMACQVGDGAVAAVRPTGEVHLLGQADSGDYSGETDFLTSRNQGEPSNLLRRTVPFVGPLRALMVMTDGVGDDYFPPDPGMGRLYADLVLNGILQPPGDLSAEGAIPEALPAEVDTDSEAATRDGPVTVKLRSAAAYASALGIAPERLAAEPARLRDGARGAPLLDQARTAEERLRLWLDAYQVRGSFDDRTLVVLHFEGGR